MSPPPALPESRQPCMKARQPRRQRPGPDARDARPPSACPMRVVKCFSANDNHRFEPRRVAAACWRLRWFGRRSCFVTNLLWIIGPSCWLYRGAFPRPRGRRTDHVEMPMTSVAALVPPSSQPRHFPPALSPRPGGPTDPEGTTPQLTSCLHLSHLHGAARNEILTAAEPHGSEVDQSMSPGRRDGRAASRCRLARPQGVCR